ncbi:MAG: alkaline phosphatase PhoX, partial [Cyanobacteriota bacterium]|nr:alkaline phosphatase PhoX [Cyanobacteriota bacterium]
MVWSRRQFLLFLGASAALAPQALPKATTAQGLRFSDFTPIPYPLPLPTDKLTPAQQQRRLAQFTVADDLVLPEGFGYEILAQWGDPLGESWFGYNNDYLALVETGDQAWLTVNFEYISSIPWRQGYEAALGKSLPFDEVQTALAPQNGAVNAFALAETDPLKAQIRLIAEAGLLDLGVGVLPLQKTAQGSWQKQDAPQARR